MSNSSPNLSTTHSTSLEEQFIHRFSIYHLAPHWCAYRILGKDARGFLNNLVTKDIQKLPLNQGVETLILTEKGKIIFQFWIFNHENHLTLFTNRLQEDDLIQYFDKRIFLEEVKFEKLSQPIYYLDTKIEAKNPLTELEEKLNLPFNACSKQYSCQSTSNYFLSRMNFSGYTGYLLISLNEEINHLIANFSKTPENNYAEFELLCFEGGHFFLGKDIPFETNALEMVVDENLFDFNKGCYPGQEIIARSKSRSQSAVKQIVGLELEDENHSVDQKMILEKGLTLKTSQSDLGKVLQVYFSPTLKKEIALVEIHKDFIEEGLKLPIVVNDKTIFTIIRRGAFIRNDSEMKKFKVFLQEGLDAYHQNDLIQSKTLFEKALSLFPSHPDALEAIAVVEENLGNIEEAIKLNKRFSEVNPQAVMARTNLSRLYMKKGWIEKAEEEKQKATVLMFKETARQNRLKKESVELEKNQEEEMERRKNIFIQVLKLDENDEIANFGLGKLFFEKKQYHKSIQHLEKVIKVNPQYSLAYSFLAKSLLAEQQFTRAKEILDLGIQQAQAQGNMIPLKSMEEDLKSLNEKF